MHYGQEGLDPNNKTLQTPFNGPRQWSGRELADAAEDAVTDFLKGFIPGVEVRKSTEEEDSGSKQIVRGAKIDRVVIINKKPVMAIQVTITGNERVLRAKQEDVENRPFVRLGEMRPQDPAVPKVLVTLNGRTIEVFEDDGKNFDDHKEILMRILNEIRKWLEIDLLKTKNPEEQERIKRLEEIFSMEKASPTYLEKTS
jgi:hypothetical protein